MKTAICVAVLAILFLLACVIVPLYLNHRKQKKADLECYVCEQVEGIHDWNEVWWADYFYESCKDEHRKEKHLTYKCDPSKDSCKQLTFTISSQDRNAGLTLKGCIPVQEIHDGTCQDKHADNEIGQDNITEKIKQWKSTATLCSCRNNSACESSSVLEISNGTWIMSFQFVVSNIFSVKL